MTEDQKKMLTVLEARVRQMMFLCDTLREENDELKSELHSTRFELEQTQGMVSEWRAKYDNLMMARVISVNEGEVKSAKLRLLKLVREVDKCISLLNE